MKKYYHANLDGSIERADAFCELNKKEEIDILETAFAMFNHDFTWINKETQPMKIKTSIEGQEKIIDIRYKGISGGGRPDSIPQEQRIQISGEQLNELVDINIGTGIALIIGVYKRHGIPIVVAWKPMHKQSGGNVSKQININVIAAAMRDGFAQFAYPTGNGVVCAFRVEFLHFYLTNIERVSESLIKDIVVEVKGTILYETDNLLSVDKSYNRILCGAPGTGKSYRLNMNIKGMTYNKEKQNFNEKSSYDFSNSYERVTFHPNYSYAQFVGTYKPKPKFRKDESGNNVEFVSYEFVPGPFLRIWIKAQKNKEENFLLIIEEINRANAAAVFGDIFQLLDRTADGTSEYEITISEDMKKYLINEWKFSDDEVATIKIPSNMYIWATMNSADQGVFPMDAAFKRRWNFEYIGIDEGSKQISGKNITLKPYGEVEWNVLRIQINDELSSPDLNVNEDKLIGPFFISDVELESDCIDEIFKSKLLMYLFEDVLKHRKGKLFNPQYNTFSKIIAAYDSGINIFSFNVYGNNNLIDYHEENEPAMSLVAATLETQ